MEEEEEEEGKREEVDVEGFLKETRDHASLSPRERRREAGERKRRGEDRDAFLKHRDSPPPLGNDAETNAPVQSEFAYTSPKNSVNSQPYFENFTFSS